MDELTPEVVRRAKVELFPKVRDSALFLALCPAQNEADPKFLLELGAALWFGKPIITVAMGDREVPDGLRRVSSAVVEHVNVGSPADRERLEAAITRALAEREGTR